MAHDKNEMRRTWAALISELGDALFAKWNTAGAKIFKNDVLPTLDEASRAARATVAEAAVSACSGNKTRAAQMLGVSKPTIQAALNGFRVGDPPDLWDNHLMTFDDGLFPFIRTRWPATPTTQFISDYKEWILLTIVPRCASEDVKYVALDNCTDWVGMPSGSVLAKLVTESTNVKALVNQHSLGGVMFGPKVGWLSWFNPVASLLKVPVRFSSESAEAISLAIDLFESGGATPPEGISVN